ncbi:DUF3127 domain-containing protein [Riemerella anatipestifer]
MELKGTIKQIGETQTFGNNFQKRAFVISTHEQYPQPIQIELHQDKIDLLDYLSVDDEVTVSINIRGREWTSPQGEIKYFNSIVAWKIIKDSDTQPSTPSHAQPTQSPADMLEDEDDDLPF